MRLSTFAKPRAEQTAELICAEDGRARAFVCDVRFLEQVQQAVAAVLTEFGRIDAVFNDAGTTRPGDVVSVSLEDWDMVLDVNLRGTFNVSRAVLPHMVERGSGAIINMGSVDGLTGDRNMAAYNAAKAAVVNLSRSMAVDFGPKGIRTNCICPGVIGSPAILKTFTDETRHEWSGRRRCAVSAGRAISHRLRYSSRVTIRRTSTVRPSLLTAA